MQQELYDATIVGGGPAGLYAAFYGGMRDMRIKLIEGKDRLGGFLHSYAEKMIWDVGGIPPIRCSQLIEWLSRQAMTFEPTLVFNEQVERIERLDNGIFAACDCAVYASKVRLIAGAFADAALAMNSAKLYLEPLAPSMAYVSSHNERFRDLNRELAHRGEQA